MLENTSEVWKTILPPSSKKINVRSCLFIPAIRNLSKERLKNWARADMYIFDLEDGCPTELKATGRTNILHNAQAIQSLNGNCVLRVNSIHTGTDFLADIQLIDTGLFSGIMLPMVEGPEDILFAEQQIQSYTRTSSKLDLHILIETAGAIRTLESIATCSKSIASLCLGSHDLLAEWNAIPSEFMLKTLRTDLLKIARANHLLAIDTPFVHLTDFSGCYRHFEDGKALGMDGSLLVHPDQITIANTVFGISHATYLSYQEQISNFEGGCSFENTTFLGPPAIKKMKQEMNREIIYPTSKTKTLKPSTVRYGLDLETAFVGQLITCPYELTVDESWITNWHSLVPSGNYIETSKTFAQEAGLSDRMLPFAAMINLTLCMAVEPFSETCILHLGMEDVRYEHPAYSGDTFNCYVLIEGIQPTSDGNRTVVSSQHVLTNQDGIRVLSFQRKTLFPTMKSDNSNGSITSDLHRLIENKTEAWQPHFEQEPRIIGRVFGTSISEGTLFLHDAMRSIGKSENLAFSTLFRNTHPIHFNYMRYQPNEIIVCGGFVMSLLLGNALKDLRQVVSQRIHNCSHLNKVTPENTLSSVSYVYASKTDGNIETLNLVTFGFIELDVVHALSNHPWPAELFTESTPKPSKLEAYLQKEFPELFHKIAMHIHWEVTRIITA